MTTPREFFLEESQQLLERMRSAIESGPGDESAREFHRACRGLRGSAQMAREQRVFEGARLLEAAARELAEGRLPWDERVDRHARSTVDHLWALVEEGEAEVDDAEALERRAEIRDRWEALGVPALSDDQPGSRRSPASTGPRWPSGEQAPPPEFRAYVASELTGIVDELDRALPELTGNPEEPEAHRRIRDRQKPLLGAAGLDWFPAVLDALQSVEAAAEAALAGRPGAGSRAVELYHAVREFLRESIPFLQRGEVPPSSGPAVDRLRELRARAAEDASPFTGPLVPVEDLLYRGEAAYRRILELRPALERAVARSGESPEVIEELYDLLRLAMK